MLPEDLDFPFTKKKKERAEESLAVPGGPRGEGRVCRGEAGCGWLRAKRFISSVFIISRSPLKSNVLGAFVFNTHLTLPT